MALSYPVMILSPISNEPVYWWECSKQVFYFKDFTTFLVFCFPCPNFEACCWHEIQNKCVLTNIMVSHHHEVTYSLCAVFRHMSDDHIPFLFAASQLFWNLGCISNTDLMVTWCHCLLGFPLLSSNWCVHGHIRVCIRLSWPECCDLL